MDELSTIIRERQQKAKDLAELLAGQGTDLFPNDFKPQSSIQAANEYVEINKLSGEDATLFSMAGRIVALRSFGKAAFLHFRDHTGQLQAYVARDEVGEAAYTLFKKLEVGDFVGITGNLFQTKTGEWTIKVKELRPLCKAVRPLPEKFHGLRDPEKRYRQRYLDLIMNADVRETFRRRSLIVQAFREFLMARGFLEVETPMMQPIAGGAEATPFRTFHKALGMDLFLRIAPELFLKRLVVGGFDRVFEINRNFRNEGVSTQHNPEFTMLEFYQAYATHEDLMAQTEELFRFVAMQVLGTTRFTYQGNEIILDVPWRRISLTDALEKIGGLDPAILKNREALIEFAQARGIQIKKDGKLGKILTKLFDALVEPGLIQPTFIIDYPVEVSPLARRSGTNPDVTERFELFIAGREIANGFSELNDPVDQKNRFLDQVAQREQGDEEAHCMDEDYVTALEYGMPPTAGEGIGIDRVVMLLTDAPSIREVILFPLLKKVG